MAHTAAELYNTCIGLERQLREELKHKNFYEAAVRTVRTQLRSAYEALLFNDYPGSQVCYSPQVGNVECLNVDDSRSYVDACADKRSRASYVEVCVLQTYRGVSPSNQGCCSGWREGQRALAEGVLLQVKASSYASVQHEITAIVQATHCQCTSL